jgi:hypothetical protein
VVEGSIVLVEEVQGGRAGWASTVVAASALNIARDHASLYNCCSAFSDNSVKITKLHGRNATPPRLRYHVRATSPYAHNGRIASRA